MIGKIVNLARNIKTIERRIKLKTRELRAKARRKWTSATIVAITGSSGKTTTAALLTHILSDESQVISHFKKNGYVHALKSLRSIRSAHRYAVLEQGTDRPGQIARVAGLIKPDVAIVTLVAIEHYSAFRSVDVIAREKGFLVEAVREGGFAVLNFDDPNVRAMAQRTRARSVMFGTTGGDYIANDIRMGSDGALAFELTHRGRRLELRTQLLGAYNWLSVAAAATTALELGIHPDVVAKRIAQFEPVRGRMSWCIVPGGSRYILDTAKAPFYSVLLPLDPLQAISARRKRFVMGQISDYSGNPKKKYKDTYTAAAKIADQVYFVGSTANKARAPAADVESGKFRAFATVEDLAVHLKETAIDDEVVVVKSSRNLHLERLALNRIGTVNCWANECGVKGSCQDCGLYEFPFPEHGGKRQNLKSKGALER